MNHSIFPDGTLSNASCQQYFSTGWGHFGVAWTDYESSISNAWYILHLFKNRYLPSRQAPGVLQGCHSQWQWPRRRPKQVVNAFLESVGRSDNRRKRSRKDPGSRTKKWIPRLAEKYAYLYNQFFSSENTGYMPVDQLNPGSMVKLWGTVLGSTFHTPAKLNNQKTHISHWPQEN